MEENGKGTVAEAEELARRPDVDVVPTAPEEPDLLRSRRARIGRRLFMTGLFAVLALGLAGWLGVETAHDDRRGGGYELTVTYGQVSRGGLATPWSLEVRHPGGFDGPITISTSTQVPRPVRRERLRSAAVEVDGDARRVIWEFDPPDGDTLGVSLDARVEPGAQWGRTGETSVLVDGKPVVTAKYKTWVLP